MRGYYFIWRKDGSIRFKLIDTVGKTQCRLGPQFQCFSRTWRTRNLIQIDVFMVSFEALDVRGCLNYRVM